MQLLRLDLKREAEDNENFRKVLFTGPGSQLVLMALAPREETGVQTHDSDRFIYVIEGHGEFRRPDWVEQFQRHSALCIPAGTVYNIANRSDEPMKLIAVLSPPEYPKGTVHLTKAHAMDADQRVRTGIPGYYP